MATRAILVALALGVDEASGHSMMTKPQARQLVHHTAIDPKTQGADGFSTIIHYGAQTDYTSLNSALGGGAKAKAAANGHGLCGDDGGRRLFEDGARARAPQRRAAVYWLRRCAATCSARTHRLPRTRGARRRRGRAEGLEVPPGGSVKRRSQ